MISNSLQYGMARNVDDFTQWPSCIILTFRRNYHLVRTRVSRSLEKLRLYWLALEKLLAC